MGKISIHRFNYACFLFTMRIESFFTRIKIFHYRKFFFVGVNLFSFWYFPLPNQFLFPQSCVYMPGQSWGQEAGQGSDGGQGPARAVARVARGC